MVPCPWFPEFAEYARTHPQHDYGVHLTLNSEWKTLRWGPVAPRDKVPSLLDASGNLWPGAEDVAAHAKAGEVEIELRAQIERARKAGVPVSHIDTHMGSVMTRRDLVEVYAHLALEFDLPILWLRRFPSQARPGNEGLRGDLTPLTQALARQGLPMLDGLTTGVPSDQFERRRDEYLDVIRKLPPGVSQIIIHCGVAGDELRAATNRWAVRDLDRRIFTDAAFIKKVKEAGVELVGWRKLHEITRAAGKAENQPAP
jgi:predicted glycoside hydrolase/deacetylase ChbG (UPF0249 family)